METGKENRDREKGYAGKGYSNVERDIWRYGETEIRARIPGRENGIQEMEMKIHESKILMLGMEKRLAVKGNMYIGKENRDPGKKNSNIWKAKRDTREGKLGYRGREIGIQ